MTDATLMSTPADAPAFADGAHARPALPGAMVLPTATKSLTKSRCARAALATAWTR